MGQGIFTILHLEIFAGLAGLGDKIKGTLVMILVRCRLVAKYIHFNSPSILVGTPRLNPSTRYTATGIIKSIQCNQFAHSLFALNLPAASSPPPRTSTPLHHSPSVQHHHAYPKKIKNYMSDYSSLQQVLSVLPSHPWSSTSHPRLTRKASRERDHKSTSHHTTKQGLYRQ